MENTFTNSDTRESFYLQCRIEQKTRQRVYGVGCYITTCCRVNLCLLKIVHTVYITFKDNLHEESIMSQVHARDYLQVYYFCVVMRCHE